MRIRSPAHFYIKALFAQGLPNDEIYETLLEENLDPLQSANVERMRKKFVPPNPFYPKEFLHTPSATFIQNEGIVQYLQNRDGIVMARAVLERPRAKEWVETMLLVRVPDSTIAEFVQRQWGFKCTADGIHQYAHYFWNIDLLDSTQMRLLLALRFDLPGDEANGLFKDKKKLLEKAYYKDPRKMAADMPPTPTSALLLQMRLGGSSPKQATAVNLQAAQEVLSARLLEALNSDSLVDSQKAVNYVNGARVLQDLLDLVVKPDQSMKDQLKISLRTEQKKMTSVHALGPGSGHTVDVLPIETNNDE